MRGARATRPAVPGCPAVRLFARSAENGNLARETGARQISDECVPPRFPTRRHSCEWRLVFLSPPEGCNPLTHCQISSELVRLIGGRKVAVPLLRTLVPR